MNVNHRNIDELEAGLNHILKAPKENGIVQLIVCRPKIEIRETLKIAKLDKEVGLVGDNWNDRGSSSMPDNSSDMEAQLTIMNSRVISLMTPSIDQWQLAGDQLYIDMDLSRNNLIPGRQIKIGSAVVEVSKKPHTGCKKFSNRFGIDALKFVSTTLGQELALRGINTRIVQSGIVQTGDVVKKHDVS
mgnify:CR=1 FL=1